jgi:CRP-like cAMP-binding protein
MRHRLSAQNEGETMTLNADRADTTWNPATPWPGWTKWLGRVPLFSGLPRRELKKVAGLAQLKSFAAGQTIVREGAAGDAFFVLLTGEAKLHTGSGLARDLHEGESFGELALIDGQPRAATVVARDDVSVARIARAAFLDLLREEPLLTFEVMLGVVKAIRQLESAGAGRVGFSADGSAADAEELVAAGRASKSAARLVVPLLAGVPLFADLPQKRLLKIARLAEVRQYAAGAVVARAGARGGVFSVVAAGRAEAVTPDGHSRIMVPGSFFGELSLLDGAPRAATVKALDELVAVRISRADLMRLLDEEPTISLGLLRGVVALLRDIERSQAN